MSNFFIAKNGEQSGPFSLRDIVNQLGTGTLSLTDYIYDEVTSDWVMLMSHNELAVALSDKKPSLPPPGVSVSSDNLNANNTELSTGSGNASQEVGKDSPPPILSEVFVNKPNLSVESVNKPDVQSTPIEMISKIKKKVDFDLSKLKKSEEAVSGDLDDTGKIELSQVEEKTREIDISILNNDNENLIEKKSFVEAFNDVSNCVYQEKIEEIKSGKGSIKEKALKISRALEEVVDPIMSEWYILKDDNKYGPYTYKDMLNMLDEKFIYGFDFVWHKSLSNWRRLADLEAFTYENINKLKNTYMPELTQIYYKRRHKRVNYGHSIMIHDNKRVWKAKSVQIGQGGVGVLMEQTHVIAGQTLYLHFQPGDGVPPFNAVCEVVSKKIQENKKTKKTEIFYGMKFIKISNDISNLVNSISKIKKVS